jgi:hypothetical protein
MQNKHSTSCALSALITLNSNLEAKILIFTKHSLYVLCEEDVQINLCEGSSKKTWNQF